MVLPKEEVPGMQCLQMRRALRAWRHCLRRSNTQPSEQWRKYLRTQPGWAQSASWYKIPISKNSVNSRHQSRDIKPSVRSRGQSKPLVMLVLLSHQSHVPVGHSTLWPLVKSQAEKWTVSSYRQALRISSGLKGGKERLTPRSVSLRTGLGLSLISTPENWSTRKLTLVSYCIVHIQSL